MILTACSPRRSGVSMWSARATNRAQENPVTPDDLAALLAAAFAARRPVAPDEAALQARIAQELEILPRGLRAVREFRLDERSRLDLLVEGPLLGRGVAVEVKVHGGLGPLTRQLCRYAEHAAVDGILVVPPRHDHRRVPDTLFGKPVAVLYLGSYLL